MTLQNLNTMSKKVLKTLLLKIKLNKTFFLGVLKQKRVFNFFLKHIANGVFSLLLKHVLETIQCIIQLAVGVLGICSTKTASVRQEDVFRITLTSGVPHLSIALQWPVK